MMDENVDGWGFRVDGFESDTDVQAFLNAHGIDARSDNVTFLEEPTE